MGKYGLLLGLLLLVASTNSFAVKTAEKSDLKNCPLFQARYKPHKSQLGSQPAKLDFVMTVKEPKPGEGGASFRSIFFYIDAYDHASGKKVSTMRLGDVCSNGIVICSIDAYAGQFSSSSDTVEDFKTSMNFKLIALRRDFSPTDYYDQKAPYVYILPNTASAFWYERNEYLHGGKKNWWDKYVHFYTDKKIIPDFGGYDVWVLDSCDLKK